MRHIFAILILVNACSAIAGEFSFAWITDTHIATTSPAEKNYSFTARLDLALQEIRTSAPDFLIHGGDGTDNAGDPRQLTSFAELMTKGPKWFPIAGNHDILNTPTSSTISKWIAAGFGRGAQNREYYGITHKGAAFFVLNTFANESTSTEMRARAEDQLREMDRFFAENANASPKIVCGHAPLFTKQADEPDEYFNVKQPYRARVIEIMLRHGANVYLAGHRHGDYEINSGGIRELCQTALSFQIGEGNRPGWYMFHVSGPEITREFLPLQTAEAK